MDKAPKAKKKKVDVAVLQGPTEDGKGTRVIRYQDGTLSAGEVRPVQEGKPLGGELVKLTPSADNAAVCEVEVLHDGNPSKSSGISEPDKQDYARKQGHGPARVSNDVYRKNWNQVFGRAAKPDDTKPRKSRKPADYSVN